MKRLLLVLSALLSLHFISAQSEFDLLKILQPEINGTARYTAMAGAFGALGGDPSAIKDNPAGLGIYRSSELTGTLSFNSATVKSLWGSTTLPSSASLFNSDLNNVSLILSSPTNYSSLKRSNWGFNYNRLKSFDRKVKATGSSQSTSSITDYMAAFTGNITGSALYESTGYNPYNNENIPWISILAAQGGMIKENPNNENWESLLNTGETVSPTYTLSEQGYMDEYAFSWSGNFNNRLFLGATLNIYDVFYQGDSQYAESFSGNGGMSLVNMFRSKAQGVGFKIGTILIPIDFIRLGMSVELPTVFTVSDEHFADLNYFLDGTGTIQSPLGSNEYKFTGALKYNLSAAFIMGNQGVLGIEYVTTNNKDAMFNSTSQRNYTDENDSINTLFNNQHMLKVGAEFKLSENISIRGGYASTDPASLSKMSKVFWPNTIRTDTEYFVHKGTEYLTAGIGYREAKWYFDLAVMNKIYKETFYAYNSNIIANENLRGKSANITTTNFSVVATLGFKF